MSQDKFRMVAKTFEGLEDVLRDELLDLHADNVEIGTRMVSFEGDLRMLYKTNLCCRTALRILKPIVMFTADTTDDLYDYLRDLDWEQFMDSNTTFSVDSTVSGDSFTHSKFVTYRVKDAIVDHFRDKDGSRPSIRLEGADLQLNVHIAGNRVTVSLDSSGTPLYKRGYRVDQTDAPINEVLAAGIILKTGWRGDSDFLDPMCGSGTFLIEAALIAANINPGIYRENFAFEKWKDFDSDLFEEIYNDDSAERDFNYKIFGGDIDPEAIAVARKNIRAAHVEEMVELACQSFTEWNADSPEGILVTNPPYGERLRPANLDQLYRDLGSTLKNNFQGWHAWIIGYQENQMREIGLKPSVKIPLHNGSLDCTLREYVMFDGEYSEFRAEGGSVSTKASQKIKSEGPRKVRRISDDDWEKETKKFNRDKGFQGKKDRDQQNRRDGGSKPKREGKDFHNYRQSDFPENDTERFGWEREKKSHNRHDNDFKPRREGKFDGGRTDDRSRQRRDDGSRNRRDGGLKPRREGNQDNGRRDDGFRQRRDSGSRTSTYKPGNSHGPRLPKSSETVINPIYLRKRKNRSFSEEED